jgi:hypothetical protein
MKDIRIPLAMLLIGIGLLLGPDISTLPIIPDWVNPINWIVPRGPATVVIIEETKDRAVLPVSQIAIMTSATFKPAVEAAGGTFLGCFDKDIVDRDKKVPADLAPYLEAAKKTTLPALVIKRGNRITAIPLPTNEKTALEKVK